MVDLPLLKICNKDSKVVQQALPLRFLVQVGDSYQNHMIYYSYNYYKAVCMHIYS